MSKQIDDVTLRQSLEFRIIGNRAVPRAQEENRRSGIPNAYSHNGTIYYEMPDGRITLERPAELESAK